MKEMIDNKLAKKLGKRATAYAELWNLGGRVPNFFDCPRGVEKTLNRVLGPARTIDRGELGYWRLPESDSGEEI